MTAQSLRIFRWHVLRHLCRHPLLATLNILSVALGVAVFLATQIANHSANRAFASTIDVVAGKAELEVTAPAGHFPETVLPAVTKTTGVSAATPVIRGFVTLPEYSAEYLDILGIDIFTNEPFRALRPRDFDTESFDIEKWLGGPAQIAVTDEFARKHHLKTGDKLRGEINTIDHELEVGFVLGSEEGMDPLFAAMDIGWAQELLGRRGELSAIQVRLTDRADREKVAASLRLILPEDVTVAAPARRTAEVEKIVGGFELNLAAMSLLSLLVGMFLIYNTVSASVLRRRREIGILRSLGVRRGEVRALFLGEAMVLGGIGSCLGLAGGVLLARVLVHAVAETISSLYVLVNVRNVAVDAGMLGIAWIIGLVSVLISAWLPARAAARIEPVRALHADGSLEKSLHPPPSWLWSGLFLIALATAFSFLALSTGPRWLGFASAFFLLAGASSFVPWLTHYFSSAARRLFRHLRRRYATAAVEPEHGAANLSRALLRNSVTIAALSAAVAMTVGVSVMVFSFRQTVKEWIGETLVADLFIAPASNEIVGPSSFVPAATKEFLVSHPAVAAVDTFREINLPMAEETAAVAVIGGSERRHFQFLRGHGPEIMGRFRKEPCAIISESFARRHHLREGESLELTTPEGARKFPIAGVVYDYSSDQGIVYMSQETFFQFWHDDRVNSVAVYLKDTRASETLIGAFRQQFSSKGQFVAYSNRSLRERIFEIFDQTFAVTYVLRTVAVIVAITGIFLSLTTLITERSRELAIVRAIGGSAGQIRRLLLFETGMLGVLAGMIGLASGLGLALVLTGVINRAFFGWTIHLAFPWRSLVITPFWIFAVALAAGIWPAWRAGRLNLAESLRNE